MRYQGRITGWKDEQGFGFVVPNGGGQQAFVHIKEFARGLKRPLGTEIITYELAYDPMGRPQAQNIAFAINSKKVTRGAHSLLPAVLGFAALFLLLVGAAVATSKLPPYIFYLYAALSCVTFVAYSNDKSAAQHGRWRTAEATLHLLALAGGWPGAAAAQSMLRHKSVKAQFQLVYRATIVLNCIALCWLVLAPQSPL
jgi:uncharacterized membrane protein YsdA (DUF1294 family)/cold shock CspA family protein